MIMLRYSLIQCLYIASLELFILLLAKERITIFTAFSHEIAFKLFLFPFQHASAERGLCLGLLQGPGLRNTGAFRIYPQLGGVGGKISMQSGAITL